MKKLLLSLLLPAAVFGTAHAQLNYVYEQRLNDVFDSVCARFKIKGASAAIYVPNEGMWQRSYGVSHAGTPVGSDMYLGIGSNTKTYTAALMLKLQEQSKLDLDDTIGQWVQHPNIPGNITIRQVLNHTSGLYSYTNSPKMNQYISNDFTKVWPPDSVLNLVDTLPSFAPGTSWSYSNTNYLVAGLIVRAVTGKTFYQALRDEIFSPQGLAETYFYPQETPVGVIPHAWSTVLGSGNLEDMIVVHNYSHNAMFSLATSAGALMSTARDNVKFWDKLMTGKIINSSSLAEMQTLIPIGGPQGYGLGIFGFQNYNGKSVVSHGGTNFGFINDNIYDKGNGVAITVLTNQDSVSNGILLNNVISALHKVTNRYTDVVHIKTNGAVKIYPNPASTNLHIQSSTGGVLQLTDITGRKLLTDKMIEGTNTLDMSSIKTGTYFISIITDDENIYRQTVQVIQ